MSSSVRASLAGLAAILLWSLLALMTAVSGALPPFQLLALSFAIGGLFGAALLLRRGRLRRALKQPPQAALLATAALFGYHALYFFALKNAPVVEANLINYLWPLLIVVFAALIAGQSVRPGQWLGTVLGLCAALLVVTRGRSIQLDADHLAGYLAALAAALTWAAYSVLNRRFAAIDSAAIVGPCLLTALLGAIAHLTLEQSVSPTLTLGSWHQARRSGDARHPQLPGAPAVDSMAGRLRLVRGARIAGDRRGPAAAWRMVEPGQKGGRKAGACCGIGQCGEPIWAPAIAPIKNAPDR